MTPTENLIAIGAFSRLTNISVRMLRYYQEHAVLTPAYVDPASGRRFYSGGQLRQANIIVMLRDAGFSVDAILRIVGAQESPGGFTAEIDRQHANLLREADAITRQLAQLDSLRIHLSGRPNMTDVSIETVPEMTVAARRRRIPAPSNEGRLWEELMTLLRESDAALPANGMSGATFHDAEYRENDADVEVWVEVTSAFEAPAGLSSTHRDRQKVVTTTVTGDYAQVTAATEKVGEFIAEHGLNTAPMFNIYHVGPAQNPDPNAWVTQLCFPVTD